MVAIKEGEEVLKKEADDANAEKEKAENSKDQSLPPSSAEETDGKDLTDSTPGITASQEKTTENADNAVATGNNNNTVVINLIDIS